MKSRKEVNEFEGGKNMKRIIKINENEYISKEVEHTTSLTGTIIELIIYLSLLAALTKFVNNWYHVYCISDINSIR